MKREIKFRSWDKVEKKMYQDVIWTGGHAKSKDETADFSIPEPFCELMQYTGLKDKNGKEIYEGDIVKSTKEFNEYTGLNSEIYGGYKYEVKNNGWRFYLEPNSIYVPDLKSLEIIGNIWENGDLLGK